MPTRPFASRSKAIAFLNSGLGLWFLSTIVIGSITFGYGLASNAWSAHERRTENIRRLAVEIRTRTAQFEGFYVDSRESNDGKFEPTFKAGLLNLLKPPSASMSEKFPIYGAFSEYRDRPMVSLSIELLTITQNADRQEIVKVFDWAVGTTAERVAREKTEILGTEYKAAFASEFWKRAMDLD